MCSLGHRSGLAGGRAGGGKNDGFCLGRGECARPMVHVGRVVQRQSQVHNPVLWGDVQVIYIPSAPGKR